MELKLLCKSIIIGLSMSAGSAFIAHASTPITNTPATPASNNPTTKDGTPVARSDQPANFDHVQEAQARETLTKYGRPHNIPLMTYLTMRAFTGNEKSDMRVTSLQGRWRKTDTWHYHGGMDLGSQGRRDPAYAGVTGRVIDQTYAGTMILRNVPQGDKVIHVHAERSAKINIGTQLTSTLLSSPYSYGSPFGAKGTLIGTIGGRSKGKKDGADVHDHVEYHVRSNDPRVSVRVYGNVENNEYKQGFKIDRTTSRSVMKADLVNFKQIDPTPYFAYDSVLKHKYRYTGGSMFTAYNNVYNTQLPAGLFAPLSEGGKAVTRRVEPAQKPPVTLFSGSAYAKLPVTMEQLGSANTAIIDYAQQAESAGFAPSEQILTQRMLASHMSDEDGETWGSVFGVAEPTNPFGMSQDELVRHLGTKRLNNPDWHKQVVRLSAKGLFTEFMLQRAEINFMYGLLTKLEHEQIKQDAVLSRLMMNHMDKAVEATAETVELRLPPDFAKVHLEKKGDEWVETEVMVGGDYAIGGEHAGGGTAVDVGNLPNDINALTRALLEALAGHESKGSYNAFNKGTACQNKGAGRSYMGMGADKYAPITIMTPAQLLTRYYGVPYNNTRSGTSSSVSCSSRLFAVGKYQWTPSTLSDMMYHRQFKKNLNIPFSPEMQEAMAVPYFFGIKRPEIGKFLKTGKGKEVAKAEVAREWASIAMPSGKRTEMERLSRGCPSQSVCDTYYDKIKGNKAFYESTQKVWAILDKIEAYHNQQGGNQ